MKTAIKPELTNRDIEQFILNYMADPKLNSMKEIKGYAFDTPHVGFSLASDSYYSLYKNHIDPDFYRTPVEWLNSVYKQDFDASSVSIISWVLPHTPENRRLSREKKDCPTLEWQMVRVHGEECNRAMAESLQNWLRDRNIEAVAPMVSPEFSWNDSEQFFLISNWSERHTAFVSGLGTFGLCDGLISKAGKAARYGSVIANVALTPTKREYSKWNEYCQAKNGCQACINRCPAGAITKDGGHNKELCRKYHNDVIAPTLHDRYNYDEYAVCGLCQTGVPCECGIPKNQ